MAQDGQVPLERVVVRTQQAQRPFTQAHRPVEPGLGRIVAGIGDDKFNVDTVCLRTQAGAVDHLL